MIKTILGIAARDIQEAGVEWLLVGGLAVNQHGYARQTLDVDLMIAADDIEKVRSVMTTAGFTDVSIRKNVGFFRMPDMEPRVDFLRVDNETMQKLLARAVEIKMYDYRIRIPTLKDLFAMKIFALAQNTEQRMGKDLSDIAYLTVINHLDVSKDIRPLCERFGTQEVYDLIRKQVKGLCSS